MRLPELSTREATAIRSSVEKYTLKQWGFVIFRCTYKSQEKWDQFISLMKSTRAITLSGETWMTSTRVWPGRLSRTPRRWRAPVLRRQLRSLSSGWRGPRDGKTGRAVCLMPTTPLRCPPVYGPRYTLFLHADEESLESVVDDAKAREHRGYFCKVVRAGMAMAAEQERQEEGGEQAEELGSEDEEEELLDVRKRVKLDKLVALYAFVLNTNSWYNIFVEDGVVDI